MTLTSINDQIPNQYKSLIMPGETVYHFAYIDRQGGCSTADSAKQWIMVSNLRIAYEASVQQENSLSYQRASGSIPLPKVSFVETTSTTDTSGCSGKKVHLLKITSSGGQIKVAIPTEQEAKRIQSVVEFLISSSQS